MKRFLPDVSPFVEHSSNNLLAVALPYVPVVGRNWRQFSQQAAIDYNLLRIWTFVSVAMLCHDTWFFVLHTTFHKVRRLYKHVHVMHHSLGASCSVLGNAYADAMDIGLCFVSFHAALYLYLCHQQSWNPLAVMALIMVEAMTNIAGESPQDACSCVKYSGVNDQEICCAEPLCRCCAGHCGYKLPFWLHLLVTGGVGILPTCANSKTHYIHHVQPRYNRAIYFVHWDYLTGTYKDSIKGAN